MIKALFIASLLVASTFTFNIQGINFVSVPFTRVRYSDPYVIDSLVHLKATGANFVSIPVTLFQDSTDSCSPAPIFQEVVTDEKINDTPTDLEIKQVIRAASQNGLKSIISLQIEINQAGWISESKIGAEFSPYQTRLWFERFTVHAIRYAKVAEQAKADILCLGHNLFHLSKFEIFWNQVIEEVRKVYSGKLTYSASVKTNEFRDIGFWGKLDLIGVAGDIDIVVDQNTEASYLDENLEDFVHKIKYLEKTWKKKAFVSLLVAEPVFEVGSDKKVSKIHHKAQANFLEGFLSGLEKHTSLEGVVVGSWVPHPAFGGEDDASISPQFKESEKVIRKHFGGDENLGKQPQYKEDEVKHNIFCDVCETIDL